LRSSEYFRAQASLYHDLAQLLSDHHARDAAMTTAADYQNKAMDMEKQEQMSLAVRKGGA
jgi:hypothetical protein